MVYDRTCHILCKSGLNIFFFSLPKLIQTIIKIGRQKEAATKELFPREEGSYSIGHEQDANAIRGRHMDCQGIIGSCSKLG